MLGGVIQTEDNGQQYYIILGYKNIKTWDDNFLRSLYYHWTKCELLLRDILPAIHERHIVSSTSWNAVIKALGSVHPIAIHGNQRRILLRFAMSSINLGNLLRKAVGISRQSVTTPKDLLRHLSAITNELRVQIEKAK